MKILHIINGLAMGGAENLLVGLAGGQVKCGNDVTVTPLVCPGNTIIGARLKSSGVKVEPLRVSGSVYNPLLVLKIFNKIKKFDIVHVHLFPSLYWAGIANLLNFRKIPIVYTEHSTNNRRRGNKVLFWADRIIYKYCYKKIIACADKVLKSFNQSYPDVHHCCVINNGVDVRRFSNAAPYAKESLLGVSENDFVVTMVARFMSMKRQDTIVEALAKLPKQIHVAFVGGEEHDEGLIRVRELAVRLNVIDRVHFLYIRQDVPEILKTSDVVLMASDYEGLSLSSIEGMAAGKPFIASDVDGLREVVGGAGLLYANNDAEELAESIYRLYRDKSLYNKIRSQCYQRAKEYDIENMVYSYMQVYNDIRFEK